MTPSPHDSSAVSLRLSLLDVQVLDADGLPVGRVDDLELEPDEHRLRVTGVLIGQRHLGPRLGGVTGHLLTWSARRLAEDPNGGRVEAGGVASWSGMLRLRHRLVDLPIADLEKALATSVVRHVPGADDAGV